MRITTSPDETLAYPHYTDRRWDRPQLIYGKECKTDECNYSDRLWEWDYETAYGASEACRLKGITPRTAWWVEAWLSEYHQKPVTLKYILGGCNLATGYEYYVYGYDYQEAHP
jgi:hypothetical protein